jgi:hypothetical protein
MGLSLKFMSMFVLLLFRLRVFRSARFLRTPFSNLKMHLTSFFFVLCVLLLCSLFHFVGKRLVHFRGCVPSRCVCVRRPSGPSPLLPSPAATTIADDVGYVLPQPRAPALRRAVVSLIGVVGGGGGGGSGSGSRLYGPGCSDRSRGGKTTCSGRSPISSPALQHLQHHSAFSSPLP